MRSAILGSAGSIGRFLAERLCEGGVSVAGFDRVEQSARTNFTPVLCDLEDLRERHNLIADAECVIVCLPRPLALRVFPVISGTMKPAALLVETLSVKSHFAALSSSLDPSIEYLSVNPLFSPDLGVNGQNVAVVRRHRGPKSDWFVDLWQRWGAHVTYVSAVDHDRAAAQIQALTHTLLLCLGLALTRLPYDLRIVEDTMTPPHRALLSLLARLLGGNPEVYWEIQAANSETGAIRSTLTECSREMDTLILAHDHERFYRMLDEMRAVFGPKLALYADTARRALATSLQPGPNSSGKDDDRTGAGVICPR